MLATISPSQSVPTDANCRQPIKPPPSREAQWTALIQNAIGRRLNGQDFKTNASPLARRSGILGSKIMEILLQNRFLFGNENDPVIPVYVGVLLENGWVSLGHVLSTLLKACSLGPDASSAIPRPDDADGTVTEGRSNKRRKTASTNTIPSDIRIFQEVLSQVSGGTQPKSTSEATVVIIILCQWVSRIKTWVEKTEQQRDGLNALDSVQVQLPPVASQEVGLLLETAGFLIVALPGNQSVLVILSRSISELRSDEIPELFRMVRDRQKALDDLKSRLLEATVICAQLCSTSTPLVGALGNFQKQIQSTVPAAKDDEPISVEAPRVTARAFDSNAFSPPSTMARASLFIYINAMLVGRPLVDDIVFLNYLNNRYPEQPTIMIEDLIVASFDVLSNGQYKKETVPSMHVFRSFLVNKLPPFIQQMISMSAAATSIEECIVRAFARIDHHAFPSFSQMFDSMNSSSALSDVRQEFLFSCALHKLIPESSIERLLGENPMQTLRPGALMAKDQLVKQITANSNNVDKLLDSLYSMEGNAGAISSAIIEVIHSLCRRKATVELKDLCNSLSRKPHTFDVILLFHNVTAILQPLCSILDDWKWEEDHGEGQPVYDEFSGILLLVLAFKYRYDLSAVDLGVTTHDSFVLRVLETGSFAKQNDELSEKQAQHLSSWVTSLFVEQGISDDTMSQCSPQDFYLLVATLFRQSIAACEAEKLQYEAMKEGFSLLLEPFLLPSLIFALTWMAHHVMVSDSDSTIVLKLLLALLKPTSISSESKQTHATILAIVASSLERELRRFGKSRADVKTLQQALEPHLASKKTGSSSRGEIEVWTTVPSGGMITAFKNTIQSLVLWSANPNSSMSHLTYTHRQLLTTLQIRGAQPLLAALVAELKTYFNTGHGDLALDIVSNFIVAPSADSNTLLNPLINRKNGFQRRVSMLSALELSTTQSTDALSAELIARLYRRVQALNHMPIAPQIIADVTADGLMNNIMGMNADETAIDTGANGAMAGIDGNVLADVQPGDAATIDQMIANAGAVAGTDGSIDATTAGTDLLGMMDGTDLGVGMGGGLVGDVNDDLMSFNDDMDLTAMGDENGFLELDMDDFDGY